MKGPCIMPDKKRIHISKNINPFFLFHAVLETDDTEYELETSDPMLVREFINDHGEYLDEMIISLLNEHSVMDSANIGEPMHTWNYINPKLFAHLYPMFKSYKKMFN